MAMSKGLGCAFYSLPQLISWIKVLTQTEKENQPSALNTSPRFWLNNGLNCLNTGFQIFVNQHVIKLIL